LSQKSGRLVIDFPLMVWPSTIDIWMYVRPGCLKSKELSALSAGISKNLVKGQGPGHQGAKVPKCRGMWINWQQSRSWPHKQGPPVRSLVKFDAWDARDYINYRAGFSSNRPDRKSKNNELGNSTATPAPNCLTPNIFVFPQKSSSFHSFALCTFDPKCIGHHVWPCVCIWVHFGQQLFYVEVALEVCALAANKVALARTKAWARVDWWFDEWPLTKWYFQLFGKRYEHPLRVLWDNFYYSMNWNHWNVWCVWT